MRKSLLAVVGVLVMSWLAIGAQGSQPASGARPSLALSPCDIPGIATKARCGSYEVWEDREAKSGRRISLKVVVVPATGGDRRNDAFTYLAGGPGEAATHVAPFLATEFASVLAHQDVLLVDQRGTGGSHPLDCDLYPGTDPQTALGPFYPLDRVRECRAALEKTSDLRRYTTALTVDDLDEVRGVLGYDRLNLFGGSYGTRAALVFLRRHPDRVRTAVLQGVETTTDPIPLHFPEYAQNAIDAVFADCAADAACRAAFPNLSADLKGIIEKTISKPVPVDILDPRDGNPTRVSLSRNLLGEALRYLLYQSATALLVPDLVHQAAGGDFAPLAEFALFSRRQLVNGLGQGLYLSVTCSEDLPFIDPPQAEHAATGTFLGDYRYQQQRAACDNWVRGPIPPDFRQPVSADIPVMLLSGSWDPVTPAGNAREAARTLPRASSLVIPSGGHDYTGLEGLDCVGEMVNRFIDSRGTRTPDQSCLAKIRRPPFPTTPLQTKPVTLSSAQLTAIAGRYAAKGAPDLEIRLTNGKLTGHVEGEEPIVLIPVSPTRLRMLGALGSYLDVQVEDGRVTGVTLDRTGVKDVTWARQ